MANVLLGVTGSVAAVRTPQLFAALRKQGHQVRVVATNAALYFFDPAELDPTPTGRNPAIITVDADEWPGHDGGRRYQRDDPVLHIELRRWADLLVIAPLDANTLAKLACGLADNCLTCVWRAWDIARPVVLAPAMNTLMWEHPLTARHLRQVAEDAANLHIIGPITKSLACGDVGVGAMAGVDEIVAAVLASVGASARRV
jgi:phosphopantothenoylcysteine decarboxylase